jgi:hypothetical protein
MRLGRFYLAPMWFSRRLVSLLIWTIFSFNLVGGLLCLSKPVVVFVGQIVAYLAVFWCGGAQVKFSDALELYPPS